MSSLRLFSAPLMRVATARSNTVTLCVRAYASSSTGGKPQKGEANPSYAAESTPKTPTGKSAASKGTDSEDVQRYTRGKPGSSEALLQGDFAQEGDGRHFGKEKAEGETKKSGADSFSGATQKDKNVNHTLNKGTSQESSGQRYQGSGQTASQVKESVDRGNAEAAQDSTFKKTTEAIKETVKDTAKAAIRTVQPLFTDKVGEGHGTRVAGSNTDAPLKQAADALTGAIKKEAVSSNGNSNTGGGKTGASSTNISGSAKQSFDNQKSLHDNSVSQGLNNAAKDASNTAAGAAAPVVDSVRSTVAAVAGTVAGTYHTVVDSGVLEAAKQAVGTVIETTKHAAETVASATTSVLETTGLKDHVESAADKAKMSAAEFAKNTQERANELLGTGFGKAAAANDRANHIHEAANRMAEEKSETAPGSHRAGDVARAAAHDTIKETVGTPKHSKKS